MAELNNIIDAISDEFYVSKFYDYKFGTTEKDLDS